MIGPATPADLRRQVEAGMLTEHDADEVDAFARFLATVSAPPLTRAGIPPEWREYTEGTGPPPGEPAWHTAEDGDGWRTAELELVAL